MNAVGVALAAAGLVACGGDGGALVTATLPADVAAEIGAGPFELEWFVAPLDGEDATDAMLRSLYDGDSYAVDAAGLGAGQTLRLSPERVGRAQVAVVVWAPGEVTGADGRTLVAFATAPINVGADALRAYTLTLASAWDSELGTAPPACLERGAAALERPTDPDRVAVHVYGRADAPAVPTYGSCLRWYTGDEVLGMVWPDDRDCDGAAIGQTAGEACVVDPLQCDPQELNDGLAMFEPGVDEDLDGDGYSIGPDGGAVPGIDVNACAPCKLDGEVVACDCPAGGPLTDEQVHFGAREACDGVDADCDGLLDGLEPTSLCLSGVDGDCRAARVQCEGPGDGTCEPLGFPADTADCVDAVCATQDECEFGAVPIPVRACFAVPEGQLCEFEFDLDLDLAPGACRVRLFGGGDDQAFTLVGADAAGDAHTLSTPACETVRIKVQREAAGPSTRAFVVEVEHQDAPGDFAYVPMALTWSAVPAAGACGALDIALCPAVVGVE
jgi:hypothetical protein